MTLTPVRFVVHGHTFTRHEIFIETRSTDNTSWVCTTDGGSVLNTDGVFEWEPQVSSRTEDFISRTRFATPELALENFARHMSHFGPQW